MIDSAGCQVRVLLLLGLGISVQKSAYQLHFVTAAAGVQGLRELFVH